MSRGGLRRLVAAGAALLLLVLLAFVGLVQRQGRMSSPNVILITVDTLRADHLSSYGYRLPTSPTLDQLSRDGVAFDDCTVSWPTTWPSMASLLTGAYPRTTGLRRERRRLPDSLEVLPEIFGKHGYSTSAVVANFNVGKTFGFDQGFDCFVESWQEQWQMEVPGQPYRNRPGRVKRFTNAERVTDQALSWLRSREAKRPFFLWLHYMDPHGPYVPPEQYRTLFLGEHSQERVALGLIPEYQRQKGKLGNWITDLGFYRGQYDREIRHFDDQLRRLLEELDELGLNQKNTVLAVTADHGESLGEHEYYLQHGAYSYQANAHVPLILRYAELPSGRRITQPVGLVDLSPTLLTLAGIAAPASFEGQDLVPLIRDPSASRAPAYVFMESGRFSAEPQLTVRKRNWKLIHVQAERDRAEMLGAEFELYDLAVDPEELTNLAETHPQLVAKLSKVLQDWYTGPTNTGQLGEEIDLETLDAKSREVLRSLGYIE